MFPLILVPCGSGVATSTTVAEKLKSLCEQRKIRVQVEACDFKSLERLAAGAKLIVSIAPYEKINYGIPVISGIPFLTGMGIDEAMDQVVAHLKR